MKPEIALRIDYDPTVSYTQDQVESIRDEWIAAYGEIAAENSAKDELCAFFIDRICRAAELFIGRHVERAVSDAISHDEYYYEWLEEVKQEENDTLDGDFPMGNQEDMKFASPYFSVKELALIQMGLADDIYAGHYVEYADRVLVRRGFLAEMRSDLAAAVSAYSGVCYSKLVQEREYKCRRKMSE